MKDLFIRGGSFFMWVLTLLLIITTVWIIYHFILSFTSNQTNKVNLLRKLGYGKSIGLFGLMIGLLGQMFGFSSMFLILEDGMAKSIDYAPSAIFKGLEATTIVPAYGILIYLFSLLLFFVVSLLIEKNLENQYSS